MVSLKLVFLLSAFVSVHGHTRGAATWEDDNALSRHKARKLMKDNKKIKNLASDPGNLNYAEVTTNSDDKEADNRKSGGGMNNRDSGNANAASNGASGQYVAETHQCVPFNEEMQARASLSLTDDACRTNSCGGGCCRVYHWLICDTADEMPQLACVCNENTAPLPSDTPAEEDAPAEDEEGEGEGATTPSSEKEGDGLSLPPQANVPATVTPAPVPVTPAPVPVTPAPVPVTPAPVPVTPEPTDSPGAQQPGTRPPFMGGAASDSCISGSPHHNNPLFRGFTKCFGADDCPLSSECCIHSFCFCGEPDDWTGDCVARTSK